MQRERDRWILEREANTKFLHTSGVSKRARNTIKSLQNQEGVLIDDEDQLKKMVCDYYVKLYEKAPTKTITSDQLHFPALNRSDKWLLYRYIST